MPTIFLYGELAPGGRDEGWLAGLPNRPAWVRGTLWRSRRGRPALVCSRDQARVNGVLVDVNDAQLPVLDLLAAGVPRARIGAAIGLMGVHAETWCFAENRLAERAGYREPRRRS